MTFWNKLASNLDLLFQKPPFNRCLVRPKADLLQAPVAHPLAQAVLREWIRRKWAGHPACLLVLLLVWIPPRWELLPKAVLLRVWILHRLVDLLPTPVLLLT